MWLAAIPVPLRKIGAWVVLALLVLGGIKARDARLANEVRRKERTKRQVEDAARAAATRERIQNAEHYNDATDARAALERMRGGFRSSRK